MATSATSMPAEPAYVPEYDEETDTEAEAGTTTTSTEFAHGIVIKLEPESDPEDSYQYHTSWSSSSRVPESARVESGDRDSAHASSPPRSAGDGGVLTANYDHSFPVKRENDPIDCSMAVFPVRMYRSEHNGTSEEIPLPGQTVSGDLTGPGHGHSEEENNRSSGQDLADRGPDPGLCHPAARPSGVNRRKRSLVKRTPPVVPVGRKTKRRKKKADSERTDFPPGTVGDSLAPLIEGETESKDQDGMENPAVHTDTETVPPHLRPVFRPAKRGRRRSTKNQNLLVCAECGMTFRWPSRYNEHLRKHTGERPFICRECGDAFTSASYLRIHQRKHSGQLPYPCVFCHAAFAQARFLTEHRRTHAEEGAFTCEDCGLKCGSPSDLSKHVMKVHPDNPSNKPFSCHLCPAAFLRSYHLETHMRTHTGEKPFKCELCGLSYTTQASLKVHNRTHTGERPFTCGECGRGFITSGQLKKHAKTHNRPVVTVCEGSSTVYVQRIRSVKRDPGGVGGAGNKGGEDVQLEIEYYPRDSTYECEVCREVFVRSIDLASHMRHDHPRPEAAIRKENMCKECGQVFTRPHTLKVHLRSHAGVRPFKCEICGKRFTQRGNLNAHLRSHSAHKAFRCPVCGVSYSTAKYREVHMRSHGEIRPCQCVVCGSTFSSNPLLTAHMRSHGHAEVAAACTLSANFKWPLDGAPASEAEQAANGQQEDGHDKTGNEEGNSQVQPSGNPDFGQEKTEATGLQDEEAVSEEPSGNPDAQRDEDSTEDESTAADHPPKDSASNAEPRNRKKDGKGSAVAHLPKPEAGGKTNVGSKVTDPTTDSAGKPKGQNMDKKKSGDVDGTGHQSISAQSTSTADSAGKPKGQNMDKKKSGDVDGTGHQSISAQSTSTADSCRQALAENCGIDKDCKKLDRSEPDRERVREERNGLSERGRGGEGERWQSPEKPA